ncbi:MAG: bifunctional DNA primase/polymerase [Actinomycetota bacterium]|nr:bifunctional DNA primase/polymerase [Actinomycetota bacterium]
MTELLSSALNYAAQGWCVFPLHGIANGRCTCGRHECSSPGKHPLVRRGLHEATTDTHVIKEWWGRWLSANVGVGTGESSEIVVVDIDLPRALPSLDALVNLTLPRTLVSLTGGGGIHHIYKGVDRRLHNRTSGLPGYPDDLPGVDLRADGGYIVAPPSTHISGTRYEWLDSSCEPAALPTWMREKPRDLRRKVIPSGDAGITYGRAALDRALTSLRCAPVGQRNHTLNRVAFTLGRIIALGPLDEQSVRSALLATALLIGLTERESIRTIDSGLRAGVSSQSGVSRTS